MQSSAAGQPALSEAREPGRGPVCNKLPRGREQQLLLRHGHELSVVLGIFPQSLFAVSVVRPIGRKAIRAVKDLKKIRGALKRK